MLKAIVTWANEALANTFDPDSPSEGRFIFPVKGCLFFGVPHRGADVAAKASTILNLMSVAFNVNKNNVRDLQEKSQRFANITSQFMTVRSTYDIPVFSLYETVRYNYLQDVVSIRDK